MEKIKFWIALWAGKFFIHVYRLLGKEQDDRPGMLSMKICNHFLTYVSKPELTVIVTGTNGKTTVTNLLAEMLSLSGKKTVFNLYGANTNAGQAITMLKCVNIFNKPTVDAVVLESDELMSYFAFPQLDADYILITNIARDSMFRNASPDYIQGKLKEGIELSKKATLILNGDDPLSCVFEGNNKEVYFGVCDQHTPVYDHHIDDFPACHICGYPPVYNYRNYRHIGDYYCPHCGFKAPQRDFMVSAITDEKMTIRERDGRKFDYPLISGDIHQLYNVASIIALLRDYGYSPEKISDLLSQIKLPEVREFAANVNGVDVICKTLKTQNSTGSSVTMESLAHEEGNMIVIVGMDEEFKGSNSNLCEVGTYIYDFDYEFLNRDNLKQLIIAGDRAYDHQLRALLSGIPKEKISVTLHNGDAFQYVDLEDVDKVFVLKNNFGYASIKAVYQQIVEALERKEQGYED